MITTCSDFSDHLNFQKSEPFGYYLPPARVKVPTHPHTSELPESKRALHVLVLIFVSAVRKDEFGAKNYCTLKNAVQNVLCCNDRATQTIDSSKKDLER